MPYSRACEMVRSGLTKDGIELNERLLAISLLEPPSDIRWQNVYTTRQSNHLR